MLTKKISTLFAQDLAGEPVASAAGLSRTDKSRTGTTMDSGVRENLKKRRIKELVAHKNPNPNYAELLSLMAEIILKKIDPERREDHGSKKQTDIHSAAE